MFSLIKVFLMNNNEPFMHLKNANLKISDEKEVECKTSCHNEYGKLTTISSNQFNIVISDAF